MAWIKKTTFVQKFYAVAGFLMFFLVYRIFRNTGWHYWGIGMYLVLFMATVMWANATLRWYRLPTNEGVMHLCVVTAIMVLGSLTVGWIFHRSILSVVLDLLLPGTEGSINIVALIVGVVALYLITIVPYQLLAINWEMMYPRSRRPDAMRGMARHVRRLERFVRRHLYLVTTAWVFLVGASFGAGFLGHPYLTP